MELIFHLIAAHFVADFVLQPDAMGYGKNRHRNVRQKNVQPEGASDMTPGFPAWGYWLTAHSFAHGLAVYWITGLWWLGLIETALHALIDFLKCESLFNLHVDQALHILCKLAYAVALMTVLA